MTLEHFEQRAQEIFQEIPPEYREGVDGVRVLPQAQPHPTLSEVYTLGECRSEFYPSEYGGPGDVRSVVVLFYGSFHRLAEVDEGWDWEEQLWETVTHEVRHHLESLAAEDALEEQDYAEDQNFARREGESFDPLFFRSGTPREAGVYEVDGDLFIEREIEGEQEAAGEVTVEWGRERWIVPLPDELGDVHFLSLQGVQSEGGEVVLVLLRRRGAWESLRQLFSGGSLEVRASAITPRAGASAER